tara:strand:- start:5982 stop:6845 length:864 start_codon:yes stop_codon:yes gene_type:complete
MSYKETKSYKSFMRSPYRSIKHKSYFNVYDTLLEEYIGKEITFVEIGILDGGSLFMWRDFFGEQARIIGIEINESSKVWQDHGFEIYIGSQGDTEFWREFYNIVGDVDVVLDDGGHTYQQQIITVESALQHLKPEGKIIVEDTYTSYQKEYGSPSNYSFIKYAFNLVDGMNYRTPVVNSKKTGSTIHNVSFFESIVSIKLEEEVDLSLGKGIANNGALLGENISETLRYADKPTLTKLTSVIVALKSLENIPFIGKFLKRIGVFMTNLIKKINNKKDNYKLRRYFKY